MKQKLCQLLLTAVTCGVQGFSPRCLSSSDLNFFLMPTLTLQNGVNIKPSPPCWPLRRWVHPAGLHSHHPAEAGRGGSDHRRPHGAGAVRTARNKQHSAPVGKPNFPAGALRFFARCGSRCGSRPSCPLKTRTSYIAKRPENNRFRGVSWS